MEISSFSLDTPEPGESFRNKPWQHLYVLPVLLLEFLALALTRAVLPHLLLQKYENRVYLVMGIVECIRGLLAFVSCPLFGKLSDVVGRKICLLVTVAGTCAPVCSLALLSWEPTPSSSLLPENIMNMTTAVNVASSEPDDESAGAAMWPVLGTNHSHSLHPNAITVFVILLALSGIFSSTFTLVFAYISDTVRQRDERVSAYGLALATFGLSFTIGPMAGGYLAQYNTRYVFVCSFLLTVIDLIYIYAILPESLYTHNISSRASIASLDLKVSWSPITTMRIVVMDPLLRRVGQVAFLYYTSLWAVISTLVLYAAKRFQLGPERLGELMSAFGFSTMVAEVVMVRIMVPMLGEKRSLRLGLAAFGVQCAILGLAYEGWHLFVLILLSLLGNLVYPSLTSLVSTSVEPAAVGEALGAINGIKALTEGVGPLVFGSLMTLSEHSALPGWPYLVAALIVYMAYYYSQYLPDGDNYVHELERKKQETPPGYLQVLFGSSLQRTAFTDKNADEYEGLLGSEEQEGMLSEIDEDDDHHHDEEATELNMKTRLPVTFASLMGKPLEPVATTTPA